MPDLPAPSPVDTNDPARRLRDPANARRHVFSVDLEDWFHLLELDTAPPPERWAALPSRLEPATLELLAVLATHRVTGTFFVLGWVAERFPALVRHIAGLGHEIASHGHAHQLVWSGGPDEFREDLRRASDSIESACGQRPRGYRAPGFSIVERTPWAFEILAEEGFVYDSSVFPAARTHGGIPRARTRPHRLPCGLYEFPLSTVGLGARRIGYLGGGYLRVLPRRLIAALARRQARAGDDLILYVHPRDIDPDQPRLPMGWPRYLRTYTGLRRARDKLGWLLARFEWIPFGQHPLLRAAEATEHVEEAV